MSMSVNGDIDLVIDTVTLTGKVSFTFPCFSGTSNFVELGMSIDSDEIKLEGAMIRGEWFCQEDSPAKVAADKAASDKAVADAAAKCKEDMVPFKFFKFEVKKIRGLAPDWNGHRMSGVCYDDCVQFSKLSLFDQNGGIVSLLSTLKKIAFMIHQIWDTTLLIAVA
jgi:hypothetical protein